MPSAAQADSLAATLVTTTDVNPFAVLSLIVAPAVLTNASSVLAMSTSNRLARAVDRARELSKQLEATRELATPQAERRLHELSLAERRTLLLLRALRAMYAALGGFASATLLSLLGAVLVPVQMPWLVGGLEMIAIGAGLFAVGALVYGSSLLLRETRIAVGVIQERIAGLQARAAVEVAP
jgi:hypothetical protein